MDNLLQGVMVCEIGEAKGHDFQIDEKFLDSVVEIANASGDGIKCRLNHPENRGNVLSIFGRATGFRRDGNCVRADVEIFDIPERPRILTLAKQAADLCGMSLDFAGEVVKRAGQKLKAMTCEAVYGLDLVDTPAATRALFSAGETKNQWRVVTTLALPKVDEKQLAEEQHMATKKEDKKQLAEVPQPPVDETEQKHAEPDGDEGQDKMMAALAGIEKRLAALESKDGGKEEKLAEKEEPPVEDEEKEEQMATMAAKVCSIMLAKVGVKPRASAPVDEQKEDIELSAYEVKMAKSLGLDHKQFAANLARSKQVKF